MMVSLFSVFDPVGALGLSVNWVSMVLVMFVMPVGFYMVKGGVENMVLEVIKSIGEMFKEISNPGYMGLVSVSIMLFCFIGLNNGIGLFPYVFTSTSHVAMTLSLGLVFWFSFFVMGWVSNFICSSAHLVPEGAPLVLTPFMVVIESVSHLIRPITLSVRLAANMMAGHLIIGLIASISEVSVLSGVVSVLFQSLMLILEVAVSFIQAFVFSLLVLLYALDYY